MGGTIEVTGAEIRPLQREAENPGILGYANIEIDGGLVVRDVRVLRTADGHGATIRMPSRKIQVRCRACSSRNVVEANYCNHCGRRLGPDAVEPPPLDPVTNRPRLHWSTVYPTSARTRDVIARAVLDAWDRHRRGGDAGPRGEGRFEGE